MTQPNLDELRGLPERLREDADNAEKLANFLDGRGCRDEAGQSEVIDGMLRKAADYRQAAEAITALIAEVERLRGALRDPPKHRYWGAGEPDCPRDIKCGNGELHTLRCKVCGEDSPLNPICQGAPE